MSFVKTKEELDEYFGLGERKFIDAQMLGVMFETREDIVKRLLPPPLEQADNPGGMMFIAEYPKTNLGKGYREAAIFLNCKYKGEAGNYCLSMPIDNETRMHNGRDVFGLPKKLADIHLERNGNKVSGSVTRHGVTFVEIKAELTGSMPQMPPPGPGFTFKAMPRVDLQPGFDGPVKLCRQQTDVEMKSLEIGSAEVNFAESETDPWAEVAIEKITVAYYLVADNTMRPGKVVEEVDPDAFLPYYFKMTDMYSK